MKKWVFSLLCLLYVVSGAARIYDIKYLGVQDGMTNNYVQDIVQDKAGLFWFATEEGLNRFDGSRFFTYYKDAGAGESISCDALSCLLDDPDRPFLWIGTQSDGLNLYDYEKDEFRYYRHDPYNPRSLSGNCVTDISASCNGHIWIATFTGGIDCLDHADTGFEHYNTQTVQGLPDNHFWCVLDDKCGHLYAGHVRNGLSVVDVRSRKAFNFRHEDNNPFSLSGNEVTCLYQDKNGHIWVGTNVGLDMFDPESRRFVHIAEKRIGKQRIYHISGFNDGRIWVGTERLGIMIINPKVSGYTSGEGLSCSFINTSDRLSGNDVRTLYEDRSGQIWAGLWEGGVNFLTTVRPLFQQITPSSDNGKHGLTDKSVMGLCFDRQGQLWVGTNSFGLNVLSSDLDRKGTFPKEIGPCIQAICRDTEDHLWFGAFNGGLYVRQENGAFKRILPKGTEDVRVLFEDDRKQMWVGTSEGVYLFDIRNMVLKHHLSMENNQVRAITQDVDKNIWIGTYGGGVEIYSPQYVLIKHLRAGQDGIIPSDVVTQLFSDSDNRIWVATNGGLLCLKSADDSAAILYDRRKGLENNHIRAIAEDHDKNIWISTNKGISCIVSERQEVINFNYRDNVPVHNFNDRSVAESADGKLFFGSAGSGICYFDPRRVLMKQPAPRVHFTALYLSRGTDQEDSLIFLAGKKNVCLHYDENNFRIGFSTLDFALKNQVEYSYRIEGLQDKWLVTSSDQIVLQDVPDGHYRFLIRARLRNQEWSEAGVLQLDVLPPFWLTWWAKLVYTVLALLLSALSVRSYKRHLNLKYLLKAEKINHEQEVRLNEERLRFFTNITHELKTPVTLILGPLDDMSRASGIPETIKHTLAVCYQSAVRLSELISQILEFRRTETDNRQLRVEKRNIVDTVHEVMLKYEELVQKPDLRFHFTASEPRIDVYFDKEIVSIVVDNLMSNAIKYTASGDISVFVRLVRREGKKLVEIVVSDTGHGISPEALPHIFERYYQEHGPHQASGIGIGLSLVKSLIDLHKGNIQVVSHLDKGTVFTVSLDADCIYPEALHGWEVTTQRTEHVLMKDAHVADSSNMPDEENPEKLSLLIVEDHKDLREYIVDSFREEFTVYEADDGTKGLAIALDKIPDIIVSDVMMPNMDGMELCRHIKKDPRTSHIPVVLLTAKDTQSAQSEGYDAGADSYLTKPFTHALLESRIYNLILQHRRFIQQIEHSSVGIEEKKRQLRESLNQVDKAFFDKLEGVLAEHLSGDLDLGVLTREMAMSTSTLYRKIKNLTGLSPNEYIRKYKMQYAENLLLEGKYTISEIAFMVGMNSIAYFRRCFKAEYGVLPSEYLNRLKDKNNWMQDEK